MRTIAKPIIAGILFSGLLAGTSACNSTTNTAADSGTDSSSAAIEPAGSTATDTTGSAVAPATTDTAKFKVSGTIEAITQGKDGYMADLKGVDGKDYSMTVSVLRLQSNYTRFNKGDKVTVSGDTIHLGEKINVLVTSYSKP